jgi:hypothetical protein
MIDWDNISEEQMREIVVEVLANKRDEMLFQAEREEKSLGNRLARLSRGARRESEACARYSRRQAAHYQQAIDLLSAAPMPEETP